MNISLIHGQDKGFGATKTTHALHDYLRNNGVESSISSYQERKSKLQKLLWLNQKLKNNPSGKFVFVQLEMIVVAIILSHFYRKSSHVYYLRNELNELQYLSFIKRIFIICVFITARRRMTFITNALFDRRWYCNPLFIVNPQYLDSKLSKKRLISNDHIYHDRPGKQKNLEKLLTLISNNPSVSITIFTAKNRVHEINKLIQSLPNIRVITYFKNLAEFMPANVITTSNYEGMPNLLMETSLEHGTIKCFSSSKNVRLWSVILGGIDIKPDHLPIASHVVIFDAFEKLIDISNANLRKTFL